MPYILGHGPVICDYKYRDTTGASYRTMLPSQLFTISWCWPSNSSKDLPSWWSHRDPFAAVLFAEVPFTGAAVEVVVLLTVPLLLLLLVPLLLLPLPVLNSSALLSHPCMVTKNMARSASIAIQMHFMAQAFLPAGRQAVSKSHPRAERFKVYAVQPNGLSKNG